MSEGPIIRAPAWYNNGSRYLSSVNQGFNLLDNQKLELGTEQDATLYHNGTSLVIDGSTLTLDGDLTFTGAQTISTSTGNLTLTAGSSTGDVLIGDGDDTILYVDGGTNNVGIGAVSANAALNIGGTFTGSSFTSAVRVVTALTDPPGNGTNSIGVHIATDFTEVADASTTTRASLRVVRPTITARTGAEVTNSASVYISDAPTGGATPTNGHYSIFVDAGNSRFDGNIKMGTNSEFSTTEGTNGIIFGAGTAPNGTASTAGQLYSDNSGDDLSFEHADGTEDELTT